MPVYKLYYFNLRGRAEPARLCFAAAGVEYEDVRFTHEEWMAKKKEGFSPTGMLPMLEVDGKKLNESFAILRYLAREFGLSPWDSFQAGQCDMVLYSLNDLFAKLYNLIIFEKDEEKKKTGEKEFFGTHLPSYLSKITAVLKDNNCGQGFCVGDQLSYADISMLMLGDALAVFGDNTYDRYPEVKAHYNRIREIPRIKEWIQNRPVTPS